MSIGQRPAASIARGAIFWTELDPVRGSEQSGTRPCVVISADEMNEGRTVLVVPMTTQGQKFTGDPDYIVRVPRRQSGLDYESVALANQVRVVAKERLRKRAGLLSVEALEKLSAALRYVQGLD